MTDTVMEDSRQWLELASLSDYYTTYGQGASLNDIRLEDLYAYLQNPYSNIKKIRQSSKYLTNKNGILKETVKTFKTLPTLDYMLSWSEDSDEKKIRRYEKRIEDFLDDIDVVDFVKSGLQELADVGTIVTCLRKQKYIQFLDLDDLRINRMRNGKWVVEYDLQSVRQTGRSEYNTAQIIESLPDDVTIQKYNLYRAKGEDYRFVELSNCDVISLDAPRNIPFGLPLTFGAWAAVLQKEMINRVERSVADRLIKQIFILKAGFIDKEKTKMVPKEAITAYFNEISRVLIKKESKNSKLHQDSSGTGLISLLQGLELESLDVNTEMFKKELYEKIDNDIYQSLGVSPQLLWGGGTSGNFSGAEMNNQKFISSIFDSVRKFERVLNGYIKQLLPNNLKCKFTFFKTTINDRQKSTDKFKEIYMQTGIAKYWLESATGLNYRDVLRQARFEKAELEIEDILYPPKNAYTSSSKDSDGGRPENNEPTNPNTIRSKNNGGNKAPSPSDN